MRQSDHEFNHNHLYFIWNWVLLENSTSRCILITILKFSSNIRNDFLWEIYAEKWETSWQWFASESEIVVGLKRSREKKFAESHFVLSNSLKLHFVSSCVESRPREVRWYKVTATIDVRTDEKRLLRSICMCSNTTLWVFSCFFIHSILFLSGSLREAAHRWGATDGDIHVHMIII